MRRHFITYTVSAQIAWMLTGESPDPDHYVKCWDRQHRALIAYFHDHDATWEVTATSTDGYSTETVPAS